MAITPDPRTPEQIIEDVLTVFPERVWLSHRIRDDLRAAGLLVDAPTEEQIEQPAHWSKEDRLRDLHARYHCMPGNLIGKNECEWERCEFWPAAEMVFDVLTAAAGVASPGRARSAIDWEWQYHQLHGKWMAAEERAEELFEQYAEHAEHVQVTAFSMDCIDGDCEHRDENGQPEDLSVCPSDPMEVCVDCMEIAGVGRDPEAWEGLIAWPCDRTKPAPAVARAALIARLRNESGVATADVIARVSLMDEAAAALEQMPVNEVRLAEVVEGARRRWDGSGRHEPISAAITRAVLEFVWGEGR